MSQKYSALFSMVACCVISVVKSQYSGNAVAAAAASAAAAGYQGHEPIPPDPIIDNLAESIAEGLLNSPVLGSYANFQLDQEHDLFFRVGNRLLKAAGIDDPNLAEITAQAVKEVGLVNSHLYFYTNGYMLAKFLQTAGVLSYDSADYLALRIVSAIELVACTDGVFNTETVMNAVVYGFFKVLATFGLITYNNMVELFYLFAEEMESLAGKY